MKYIPLALLFCFSFFLFFSCGSGNNSNNPFSNCKYGKPQPIFEGQYEKIDSQRFEIIGMEGIEQVWFENGMQLELLQLGCDKVKQSFQFKLPGKFGADENWILLAASQFQYLSGISDRHFELGVWGQVIEQNSNSLFLGEKIILQPGYSVKIDKISGADSVVLVVELSED